MLVHIFCQDLALLLYIVSRDRFFLLVRPVILYKLIAFLTLREDIIFLLNLLGLDIFSSDQFITIFIQNALILLFYVDSIALFGLVLRCGFIFIFRGTSDHIFSKTVLINSLFIEILVSLYDLFLKSRMLLCFFSCDFFDLLSQLVNQSSVFTNRQLLIVVYLYTNLLLRLYHLGFRIKLFQVGMFKNLQHSWSFLGIKCECFA